MALGYKLKKYRKLQSGGNVGMWQAIAGLTTQAGEGIRGDETDYQKNYIGNFVNTSNTNKLSDAFENGNTGEILDVAFTGGLFGTQATRQQEEALKAERLERARNFRGAQNLSNTRLQTFDTLGSNVNQIYAKYGGKLPISKSMTLGGNINKTSQDNYEVQGRDHEQGGVKLLGQGIELEDNETINTSGDEPYVFSEELGFASKHKKLTNQMAKIEKRPSNRISNNTLGLLKSKEERLKVDQESLKSLLGINI